MSLVFGLLRLVGSLGRCLLFGCRFLGCGLDFMGGLWDLGGDDLPLVNRVLTPIQRGVDQVRFPETLKE